MKTGFKKLAVAAMAVVTALGMSMPAYAAKEKIDSVNVKISGDKPMAGEDVGSVTAKTSNNRYTIAPEDCYFENDDDDVWERGTIPVVRIEIRAAENYYFSSMSKSKVSISGLNGEYKSSKVLDGGATLQLDIKLRKVSGDLADIDENTWDGRTATWEEIDDADKYEVKLYRGSRTVTTVTTTSNKYNFYSHMTSSGDYSFKVRGISNSDGETSPWTELSDEYYVSSSDVYTGGSVDNGTGSGGSNGGPGTGSGSNVNTGVNGWNQNQTGWWYRFSDGSVVRNNWLFVDNNWFFFDGNGYMVTGLQLIEGRWFYLNPISDGTRGAMLTGVQAVNGGIYLFNMVSDGTRGAMLTGFQFVNGNWYYFDEGNGILWANRTAPNGKWIDAAGVVH